MKERYLEFVMTSDECMIRGRRCSGIPVFFCTSGVVEPFTDYLINRYIDERVPSGTLETYAYHLQKWQRYIECQALKWDEVTDLTLIRWRDKQLDIEKLDVSTVNAYLSSVFQFYEWAERSERITRCVAVYDEPEGYFRISARKSINRRQIKWYWPFLVSEPGNPNKHTPTTDELEKLHSRVIKKSTGDRDSLLLSYYEEMQLRRAEALRFKILDIPTREQIENARDEGETFIFEITGKGNKKRHVPALPELMERTRDYMEGWREDVILKHKDGDTGFVDQGWLFISEKTGHALNKQYVSRMISNDIRKAGISNASGHRVRARGLTNIVSAYDGVDEDGRGIAAEIVLLKAADFAGHTRPEYLRPYLNLSRGAGADSHAFKRLNSEAHIRDLLVRIQQKQVKLDQMQELALIADALQKGRFREAEDLAKELLARIMSQGSKPRNRKSS